MPAISIKVQAFEYIAEKMLEWHESLHPGTPNDLSKLKLFKLLFFASAVNASEENDGLLKLFDNFHAMPYGPVESDVYNNFSDCKKVNVSRDSTSLVFGMDASYYDDINAFKDVIDESITSLKKENCKLIEYSAYDLVELSHQWISWRSIFNLAKQQKKLSLPIPNSIIKFEPKILKLS